jgi:phosphosulfolactate synthase
VTKEAPDMIPDLPARSRKPRTRGLTMVIDPGMATGAFLDVVSSHGELIDLVKFGWGTALVTRDLERKVAALREAGIGFYFGGTLFEHCVWTDRLDDLVALARHVGARHVEVSNGTIPLDQHAKAEYIRALSGEFQVISEVGFKDAGRSAQLTARDWVDAVREDLDAGARLVTTETRESGRSGIARADGHMRDEVLGALLRAVDPACLLFEAPTKELQVELIRSVGPDANLGNIAATDVVGVETLRLGLRADTLLDLTPARAGSRAAAA